jgi:hypothetical protein
MFNDNDLILLCTFGAVYFALVIILVLNQKLDENACERRIDPRGCGLFSACKKCKMNQQK